MKSSYFRINSYIQSMNIVVIDGYTLNPGDLSWEPLQELGNVRHYDRTPGSEIIARCRDAEVVITNKVPFSAETLSGLPHLKYLGVSATGYNMVDLEALNLRKIALTNVPDYGSAAVAQHTIALILALSNRVERHSEEVHQGVWSQKSDFTYWNQPIFELFAKTLGLLGLGKIGRRVAHIAHAMGMEVQYCTPQKKEGVPYLYTSREEIFRTSDIVSIHTPLTPETEKMVDTHLLRLMPSHALLINTSRGGLIHEEDLAEALKSGQIGGAGLDVLSQEPPPQDHPLLGCPRLIITPHNAWGAMESRQRLLDQVIGNLRVYLKGGSLNRII